MSERREARGRATPGPAHAPWARSGAELAAHYEVDHDRGLSDEQAEARRGAQGPNELPRAVGPGVLTRIAAQLNQPLVYLLLLAAAVTGALGEWIDTVVILIVVTINATIGFFQEGRALEALSALARSMTSEASVVRGGKRRRVPSSELVEGDVVVLDAGDKVPADLRLLHQRELRVDESALTGESLSVEKHADLLPEHAGLADRGNIAHSSTLVTHGQGLGIVVATGIRSEIGKLSELVASTVQVDTPLTKRIERFSKILLWSILGAAGLAAALGLWHGGRPVDVLMAAIALAVGAIPEGLPAAMTIMLAIGVHRMAKRRAIILRLPAVETLGSTTVIGTDKTGTLTQNQMTVRSVVVGDERFEVEGEGYAPEGRFLRHGEPIDPTAFRGLMACLRTGRACNDASLARVEGRWEVSGDPTEAALLVSAGKAEPRAAKADPGVGTGRLDAVPFDSSRQTMATLHDDGGARRVHLKGSPERVLALCDRAVGPMGQPQPLDVEALRTHTEQLAARGERVLALAVRDEAPEQTSIDAASVDRGGFCFLGLQSMLDPPRPHAKSSVAAARRAGIEVKMITGDHAATAKAIAQRLAIPLRGDDAAVSGAQLAELGDDALSERVERATVFARVSPEQKLRIVTALQARGHVVAMTGDGVNDAPALRRADIGIAMGLSGTEVAKGAADMVLADDDFGSIVAAVEEGRGVFDNLRKFIVWTLPTSAGEGFLVLVAMAFGRTLPVLPVQVLWLNTTTVLALGLTLVFEPREPDTMQRPPRDPRAPLLDRWLLFRIALVSALMVTLGFALFELELALGASLATARTVATSVFVFGETFYLFACRSEDRVFGPPLRDNPPLLLGVASMVALQLAFIYLPLMNRAFSSAPFGLASWLRILGAASVVLGVVLVEKWIVIRRARSSSEPTEGQ